jgi:hypothetical protein
MTYPIIFNSMTKSLCNHRGQTFSVRRIGLWTGFTLAVLTLVNAGTLVSYAEVSIDQKDQGSGKQTTTDIKICDTGETDGVNVRVDVAGFYKLDLKISPECKADETKSDNGAVKKEKRE